jgi:hypothetical protein
VPASIVIHPVQEPGFSTEWMKALQQGLINTPSLHHLCLKNINSSAFAEAGHELSFGSSLQLLRASLVDDGCDSKFASVLPQLSHLTSLHLISLGPALKIVETLPQLPSLKSFVFCSFSPAVPSLLSILPQLRLVNLRLFGLSLGSLSSSFFSTLASLSETLMFLSFLRNSDLSMSDLVKTIPELKCLRILDLTECEFLSAVDAVAVRSFLAALSQIQLAALRLRDFVFSTEALDEFTSMLPQLKTLHRLELLNCTLGDDTKRAEESWSGFFSVLSSCPRLNLLRVISHPPLTCDLETLLPKTHLSKLEVPSSGFTSDQQAAIAKAADLPNWRCTVSF